jgi:hypothetical protein
MVKKFKCSINQNLINKNETGRDYYFNHTFENVEVDANTLIKAIKKGYAFSFQFSNQDRRSDNFLTTDIVSVDIDHWSLEEALNDEFLKLNALLIYTTVNHTEKHNRFRIVFGFDSSITKATDVRHISKALADRFRGDLSAIDSARISFGNDQASVYTFGNCISDDIKQELIDEGKKDYLPSNQASHLNQKATTSNSNLLDDNFEVKDRFGNKLMIGSIKVNTTIYCPFHTDENPSAFVGFTDSNLRFLHCRVCRSTWKNYSSVKNYNFNNFDETVLKINNGISQDIPESNEAILPIESVRMLKNSSHITITESAKFELPRLRVGISFIKSPKGSGKTTALPRVLEPLRKYLNADLSSLEFFEENEDFDGKPINQDLEKDFSILLIGHRQSLIRSMCQSLKLNCYLEDSDDIGEQELRFRQNKYGICLDSLPKIKPKAYNVIIIDESEQVLSHFLSQTLDSKREHIFKKFFSLLNAAERIVCLDADLSWLTFNTITEITGTSNLTLKHKDKDGYINDLDKKQVWLYLNNYKKPSQEIEIYRRETELIEDLRINLRLKKKIFITSNSKSRVDRLSTGIRESFPDIKTLVITSDNSNSPDIQYFIENIKTEVLKYDLVFVSPSLSTGVDITFVDDASHIDLVYGFFENQINTHFDIDQQISRVRNPRLTKIWISPRTFNYDTNLNIVKEDILEQKLIAYTYIGFDKNTLEEIYDRDDQLLRLGSLVVTRSRASMNRLKSNFIDYKHRQGVNIKFIDNEYVDVDGAKKLKVIGKSLTEQVYIQNILNSQDLTQENFLKYDEDSVMEESHNFIYSYYKHKLELFYRNESTAELIKQDKQGAFRSKVVLYETFIKAFNAIWGLDRVGSQIHKYKFFYESFLSIKIPEKYLVFDKKEYLAVLIYILLLDAGLLNSGGINFDKSFTAISLVNFAASVKKYKKLLESQAFPIRKDVSSNPTRQLGDLIRLLGLSIEKVKTIHKGHGKEYVYKISDGNNLTLSSILSSRASKSFETYQFEYWKRIHKDNSYDQVVYKPVYLTNDFGSDIKVFANSKNPYDLAPLKSSKKAKNQGYG